MDSNTNSGMKRSANYEMAAQPSSSKLPQIASTSISIGAVIHAEGNARVTINNMHVGHQQQPTPQQAPLGIEFQVADPIDTFRGREQKILEVKHAFDEQKGKQPYNLVAVCGYGGMGKTQLARMYIKRNREELQNVVWIFSESQTTMSDSFIQLRKKLTDKGYHCYSDQDVYEYLNSDLTIFIFDNSEDIRSVQTFLPSKQNSSLFLITSKSKNWDAFNTIELKFLDLTDAQDIMKAVLVDKHKIQINDIQLKELVRNFEFETIPLLLQIRAGYICRQVRMLTKRGRQYNIENIVKELNIQHNLVIEKFHNFILDPYDKSIFAAIYQTLEQIRNAEDEASKTATQMLGIASYLNPEHIDEEILKDLLHIENDNILNDSLDILDQFSLIKISDAIIGIHRTVQQCVRYHHKEIIKSNEYYKLTLRTLIIECYRYRYHHETLLKHGEKDFESLCTYYETNKCKLLHENFAKYAPSKILQLLLNKYELFCHFDFLFHVVLSRRYDILQMLRDIRDSQGFNAIFYVYLLKNDADNVLCIVSDYNSSAIWNTIQVLIKNGFNVNSQNFEGNTIIHTLCNLGTTAKVSAIFAVSALLIKLGANPEIKNNAGQTAIDLAREHRLTPIFQLLNATISGYKYISHIAAKNEQFDCLKMLIWNRICRWDDRDDTGCTIYHLLADLTRRDKEYEHMLLDHTGIVLQDECNFPILNDAGDTPSDVARRNGREMMADLFDAWVPPGHIIYQTVAHRSKIEHFTFVNDEDSEHVNEQDDTGSTILHAICDLEPLDDTELQLDIIKFAAHLVIEYEANVTIRNKKNDIAADVARRRGYHLLADFLVDTEDVDVELLLNEAFKHKQFNLVKYAWWRYVYTTPSGPMLLEDQMVWRIEYTLEALEEFVTNGELRNYIDFLHFKKKGQKIIAK